MKLKLSNTLTREKELFVPIEENKVGIYSCGPTVYNYAHIGNLRAYVFADILKRALLMNDYEVKHVLNITDVGHLTSDQDDGEDKLEKGAAREHKSVWDVAKFYTDAFFEDLKKLNIISANIYPKATDNIKEMIEFIKLLEKKGFTYIAEGNVYFDTAKFPEYGRIAKLELSSENSESRVEVDPHKKSQFDFVLWFTRYKYKNHEMEWDSPWGKGFPGWHIECSAMATKYLGEHFDIHTGGIDHIPVHHTNEIAQSEAALGHKWVNYWLHSDFLTVKGGDKMAKSTGEFLRLQTVNDKGFSPLDYRYYLLGGHYRSPMQFSFEALEHAKNSLQRAKNVIYGLKKEVSTNSNDKKEFNLLKNEFEDSINDDLNTAKALSILWKTLDSQNLTAKSKLQLVEIYDSIFGLDLLLETKEKVPAEVEELAEKRLAQRKNGDWVEADKTRDQILSLGYEVKDTKDGYELSKK